MAAGSKESVEIEAELLARARRAARERGVAVPQPVSEALQHELGEAGAGVRRARRPRLGLGRSSDGLSAVEVACEPVARPPA